MSTFCFSLSDNYFYSFVRRTNTNLDFLQRNFCLFTFSSVKVLAFYGVFLSQMELLPCKKTQKVNKQNFRCKNSRFVLAVRIKRYEKIGEELPILCPLPT